MPSIWLGSGYSTAPSVPGNGIPPGATSRRSVTLASNTQRAVVVLTDEETEILKEYTEAQNPYQHSWKVTDFPETILAEGPFYLEKASQVA